jgi:hypothetical protein
MVKKNAEFHADFKSVEHFFFNVPKKVISKNVMKICTFSTFTYVRQSCFTYNFFCVNFFKTFSTDLITFNFFKKNLKVILYFFQTLKPKAQKTAPKIKKCIK